MFKRTRNLLIKLKDFFFYKKLLKEKVDKKDAKLLEKYNRGEVLKIERITDKNTDKKKHIKGFKKNGSKKITE